MVVRGRRKISREVESGEGELMPVVYQQHAFEKKRTCDDCGANADVLLVADAYEDATGYRDEVALCRQCFKKREAR